MEVQSSSHTGQMRASKKLHQTLITSVLGTTLRWLDTTPVSRIIVRATSDIGAGKLPRRVGISFADVVYSGRTDTKAAGYRNGSPDDHVHTLGCGRHLLACSTFARSEYT
jgi:hypothetical protein